MLSGVSVDVDLSKGISIARPLDVHAAGNGGFDGVNMQNVHTQSLPFCDGDFVGDVKQGGSCNVEILKLNAHCAGTHTETLLHILDLQHRDNHAIAHHAPRGILVAALLSVPTHNGAKVAGLGDSYDPPLIDADEVISASAIKDALDTLGSNKPELETAWRNCDCKALIIRAQGERSAIDPPFAFGDQAPFFSRQAIELINQIGVQHLLVEFPSIDRMNDEGRLTNHHCFWNVDRQTKDLSEAWPQKTVTEMIYLPRDLTDGVYLLDLQIPALMSDACISRPLLFQIEPVGS